MSSQPRTSVYVPRKLILPTPTLTGIPKELQKMIIEKAGYSSIQRFRLINHTLRDFIDDLQPAYHISDFVIELGAEVFAMTITESKKSVTLKYEKTGNDTQIVRGSRKIIQENVDFMDVFFKDLKDIFNRQKSIFDRIRINARFDYEERNDDKFTEKFKKMMKKQLKVNEIHFEGNGRRALQILPLMDSNKLKKIAFTRGRFASWTFPSDELMNMEHWKSAEELFVYNGLFPVLPPMNLISHFAVLDLTITLLTLNELLTLKQTFLASPRFKHAMIHYTLDDEAGFLRLLIQKEGHYYYRIPGSDFVLYQYFTKHCSRLVRVPLSTVPPGSLIQNL